MDGSASSSSSSSASSKVELMKPVFLKAGIPLAISVLGFISAKIISKRTTIQSKAEPEVISSALQDQTNQIQENYREDEEELVESRASADEILSLKRRIEELQDKEWELEMKFIQYCELKEQESVLVELKNMLLLESAYMNFLDREVSSMNAEYKRLESLGEKCLKVVLKLERLKSQNRLLRRKAKKLVRLTEELSRGIREKDSKIEAEEEEIARNRNLLKTQADEINNLEDEMCMMRYLVYEQQEQKDEILRKRSTADDPKQNEAETVLVEEYEQLAHAFEELQKERATEIKEIIYLRWNNVCLRHELMRQQNQQEHKLDHHDNKYETERREKVEASGEIGAHELEDHVNEMVVGNVEPAGGVNGGGGQQVCSKRRKLVQKFKRWVEGSERMKEKHEAKCFGRHSVSGEVDEEKEQFIHGRRSYSST